VLAITPAIVTHAARFVVLNELTITRYSPVACLSESFPNVNFLCRFALLLFANIGCELSNLGGPF
jgi:hypothetical protein